jgi:sugar lactone lactonase YvrE
MYSPEHILVVSNQLGEGPLWDPEEQVLYWVDIQGHVFYRFHPGTGMHEVFTVGLPVGALAIRASGGFVMATRRGFALWNQHMTFIADPEADIPTNRFNDGAVDCAGRFWAGTMSERTGQSNAPEGSLYRLDSDLSVHTMDTGFAISNGIGWSPDNSTMYVTDSPRQVIYAYDFDPATGAIDHKRPFISTPEEEGMPDGLAIDSEGGIWSARWEGWKIIRYDPTGKKEREIQLPVQYPTSCAFGGKNMDELYITSAWVELSQEQREQQPFAGDLFRVKMDITGLRQAKFAG